MFGRRRRERAFEQGRFDGMRKQRDDALRRLEAYWAGRRSLRVAPE